LAFNLELMKIVLHHR